MLDVIHLVSLEQMRRIQLLMLMYKRKTYITMHKVLVCDARISRRTVFKPDSKEGTLYKRSPYFVGAKLWVLLAADVIDLLDIFKFKTRLVRLI